MISLNLCQVLSSIPNFNVSTGDLYFFFIESVIFAFVSIYLKMESLLLALTD